MKISARNVFEGTISNITPGSVNTEVEITLGGSDKLIAIVTNGSVNNLGLATGKTVSALVKASSVLVLAGDETVKLSARNVLTGKVSKVTSGQVNAEVAITLSSGANVYANITLEAVEELGIKQGITASAVFKASSVILGVSA